ncbi:hypothetical protein KI688_010113 [Linnemannia hyalina]|uniref:Phosphate transporter n=1 Tax=Linnemannia hyalina TaxID=64524 RepID=A0A9P7XXY8_9FUNG|nr:hypothetical protein KI688_010113 [Linnemannia hyalina]
MVCSLVGSSTWVLFASSRGWPVSTTHAIVGAITGIGLAGFGSSAVQWVEIGKIDSSWLISPLCAGLITTFIFLVTKFLILRHEDSLKRGLVAILFYFVITIFINVFYIIFKGYPGLSLSKLPIGAALGISFGIEGNEPLRWYHAFCTPFVKPRIRRASVQVEYAVDEKSGEMDSSTLHPLSPDDSKTKNLEKAIRYMSPRGSINSSLVALDDTPAPFRVKQLFNKIKAKAMRGLNQDINDNTAEVDRIHGNSTRHDEKTEKLFCTLQVLTSCFASFAHGSNDVANAIGSLTTIYYVWRKGAVDVTEKAPIPTWILAYGGIAADIGLLTYGYKVTATLGSKITFISPSRGFSVLLGTLLTVLTCSKLGLPVSTTHCITGATTSVGLCSGGGLKSINWKMLGSVASSWVFTLLSLRTSLCRYHQLAT